MDNKNSELRSQDGYDLGTFHFLKVGWWVLHVIGIAAVFYLGFLYGGTVF